MSNKPYRSRTPRRRSSATPERFVPYLVTQIYHRLNKSFANCLRPLRLNPAQWRVLANLASEDGRTLTELLRHTALDQPTLSRTVARLVRGGHVERRDRPSDARAAELWLTASGRRLWKRALRVGERQHQQVVRGIPSAERERLAFVLTCMLDHMREGPARRSGPRASGTRARTNLRSAPASRSFLARRGR